MERSEIVSKKKIKISAAALTAAAFAIVLIFLEVAFFVSAIPTQPEFLGKDYCAYENEKGIYTVKAVSSVRYSAELGQIENVSFLAQTISPEDYNAKPVTVKVRGYDASGTILTYKTQRVAVGEDNSIRTTINVDIPEDAGDVILELGHEGADYLIGEITFNYAGGASFNFLRAGISLAIVVIAYLCVRFKLWSIFFDPKKHSAAGLALCLLCVIISVCLVGLFGSSDITEEYPFNFDPKYYDPYEQQFDALMKGQLHLDVEPSKGLLELDNPYDYASREGVDYLWDRAYFEGRYYSYFGMAPIFTVYYPFYLVTGRLPSDSTVSAIFAVMTALFFSLAAVKWASMYTKKLPLPMLFLGTVSALFSSQVFLVMRGRSKFYYIATIAGMAFLTLFLWLILCGISGTVGFASKEGEPKRGARLTLYALAGVAYGLLFMSRVNMALLAAFIVLPMLWFRIIRDGKSFRKIKDILLELIALGSPVVLFVAAQLVMNYVRFDSFFEFGTTYQLTVSDVSLNKLRLSDLPAAILHYFLQPLSYSSDFPMVSLLYTKLESYGHYVYVDTGMGLLSIPLMWSLFGSAFVLANKKRQLAHKVALASLVVGAVAVAWFDFCLGGVIFRYTCDLTLLLSFASLAVIFSISEDGTEQGSARAVNISLSMLLVFSLLVSVSLSMSLNNNLTAYSPEAYVAFKELFIFP